MRKMGTIWECIMCGKSSKYKNDITRHIEANHISSPGIKCEICDKISPTREALRQHNKIAHQWKVKISNNIYIVNLWLIEIYNETNKYLNFKCQMFEIHQKNEIYFVGKSLKLHFNYRLISINSSCFRIRWPDCHQNGVSASVMSYVLLRARQGTLWGNTWSCIINNLLVTSLLTTLMHYMIFVETYIDCVCLVD